MRVARESTRFADQDEPTPQPSLPRRASQAIRIEGRRSCSCFFLKEQHHCDGQIASLGALLVQRYFDFVLRQCFDSIAPAILPAKVSSLYEDGHKNLLLL